MQRFIECIKQLSSILELSDVEFEENHDFNLVIDETYVLFRFVELYDQLHMYSPLLELTENTSETLTKLLESNAFYKETSGYTLALQNNLVLLQAVYPMEGMSATALFKELERFVHTHTYWFAQLSGNTNENEQAMEEKQAFTPSDFGAMV